MADGYAIFEVEDILLVSINEHVSDTDITELQQALATDIVKRRVSNVVTDISALEIVDTFVARILGQLAKITALLAASPYVVGMRPPVAMTLVELGMELKGMTTALSVNQAMRRIRATG